MTVTPATYTLIEHTDPGHARMWEARMLWRKSMHEGQFPPEEYRLGWLIQAGRGFGKTLTGAFDVVEHALDNPGWRIGVIAPTLGDVRDTCIEGETGVYQVLTEGTDRYAGMGLIEDEDFYYNRSRFEIHFLNGSRIKGYGSEKPNRLRGPQFHRLWLEELAAWKDAALGDTIQTSYNNAKLGLRLGDHATWIGTTTPRYNELILNLDADPKVVTTRGTTYDNISNLSENFLESILVYEGTPLEQQELLGEIVEISGSMFRAAWFTYFEREGDLLHLADGRTVGWDETTRFITCDPALSLKETADYTVFAVWALVPEQAILNDEGEKVGKLPKVRLLIDVVRDRLEAPDIISTGANLLTKHQASWIGFEAVAYQAALVQFARRDGLPAMKLKAVADKVTRALPLISQLKASLVQFLVGAPWLEELERELLFFPDGPHDDQVDALAYGAVEDRVRRKLTAH